MYEAYHELFENNFKVFSVKPDALATDEHDLSRVMGKTKHFIKSYRTGFFQFEEGTTGNGRLTKNQSTVQHVRIN